MQLTSDPEVVPFAWPGWFIVEGVRVVERDPAMDDPLRQAAETMRRQVESADVTAAVRTMYKRAGIDPTKTRPSSEALLRRVRRGDELPRVNNVVDVINWCSLETQLPYGLYDLDRIAPPVELRRGRPGESYDGIRKGVVNVEGRPTLADAQGAFGNPTSDSARTMVTGETRHVLVVIFAPRPLGEAPVLRALDLTSERLARYAGGHEIERLTI